MNSAITKSRKYKLGGRVGVEGLGLEVLGLGIFKMNQSNYIR